MKRSLFLSVGILLSSTFCYGQYPVKRKTEYTSSAFLHIGTMAFMSEVGFNVQLGKKAILSYTIDGTTLVPDNANNSGYAYRTHALLIGIVQKSSFAISQISIGPALVSGQPYGDEQGEAFENTLGLKIKLAGYLSYRVIGLGISPYFVLNTNSNYWWLTLNLAMGSINWPNKK